MNSHENIKTLRKKNRLSLEKDTLTHSHWIYLGNVQTIEVAVAHEIVSSCALKLDRVISILSFQKASVLLLGPFLESDGQITVTRLPKRGLGVVTRSLLLALGASLILYR